MYIEKIKLILKKYFSFFRFGETHTHSKIFHHWEIILSVFLILNILLLGFSVYIFLQINEGGIFLVEQNQEIQINTIDRSVLQELLMSFEIREASFRDRTLSIPRLLDPSR
jgi:hypothetical protein